MVPGLPRLLRWLLVVALLGGFGPARAELTDDALLDALRAGGFTLYFRHAQTQWSQSDRIETRQDLASCDGDRVRQLSAEGRATAVAVGEAMRALGIPVLAVFASPYCRALETARGLGLAEVTATDDLMNLRSARFAGGRETVLARTRARLATPPPPATNVVLVAHGNIARESTPVYPGEAEGVVFRADGEGGFELVARVPPARWAAMVAAGAGATR